MSGSRNESNTIDYSVYDAVDIFMSQTVYCLSVRDDGTSSHMM